MENRIRELRKAAGLRQEDLARELGAMRLARLLATPVEDIFHLPE